MNRIFVGDYYNSPSVLSDNLFEMYFQLKKKEEKSRPRMTQKSIDEIRPLNSFSGQSFLK